MVEVSVALKGIWLPASSYSTGSRAGVELLSESKSQRISWPPFYSSELAPQALLTLLSDRLIPICAESIGVLVIELDLA